MNLVIKIALGILLAGVVLIVGYLALAGSGADTDKGNKGSGKAQRPTGAGAKRGGSPGPSAKGGGGVGKVLDRATARGDFAIAQASGTARRPSAVELRASSTPHQKANISYTLVCTQHKRTGSKAGQFTATTPVTRRLPIPPKSSSCLVSASAQLAQGGRVTVTIRG